MRTPIKNIPACATSEINKAASSFIILISANTGCLASSTVILYPARAVFAAVCGDEYGGGEYFRPRKFLSRTAQTIILGVPQAIGSDESEEFASPSALCFTDRKYS